MVLDFRGVLAMEWDLKTTLAFAFYIITIIIGLAHLYRTRGVKLFKQLSFIKHQKK